MQIQIFGVKGNADTRKALRYFAERRIKTHFVDLREKPPSRRELLRFTQKLGLENVRDEDSKKFAELGLRAAHLSEKRWIETMMAEPLILRLPLVRSENRVAVGFQPDVWKSWLNPSPSGA